MRRSVKAALAVAAALAAGGAYAQDQVEPVRNGLLSYGMGTADAKVTVGGLTFSVYVHPTSDSLLIQPKLSLVFKSQSLQIGDYRKAAEQFVAPAGCGIPEVHAISVKGASWEASYLCPEGVDLRALILAQRKALKAGKPLQPAG